MSADGDERFAANAAAAASSEPRAGERLATARREKQISIDEIAKELHIDDFKVRALERNDFEVLGPPVFAKGHLRKYAQLVGVPVEDVLADYYALNRSVGLPPLVARVRPESREINLGRWLTVLLLLGIAVGAYWWFVEREPARVPAVAGETGRVSLPPADTADLPTGDTASEVAPDTEEPAPAVEQTAPVAAATEEPAELSTLPDGDASEPPPPPPTASGAELRLAVTYSGDCWTEITDAAGERLFFGLGSEGRTIEVSGTAPLSVLFGNADNVSLALNGTDYPIPPANRRGLTARLSIQAP
jgi:cytoskeletal protein RodZ